MGHYNKGGINIKYCGISLLYLTSLKETAHANIKIGHDVYILKYEYLSNNSNYYLVCAVVLS